MPSYCPQAEKSDGCPEKKSTILTLWGGSRAPSRKISSKAGRFSGSSAADHGWTCLPRLAGPCLTRHRTRDIGDKPERITVPLLRVSHGAGYYCSNRPIRGPEIGRALIEAWRTSTNLPFGQRGRGGFSRQRASGCGAACRIARTC